MKKRLKRFMEYFGVFVGFQVVFSLPTYLLVTNTVLDDIIRYVYLSEYYNTIGIVYMRYVCLINTIIFFSFVGYLKYKNKL